MQCNLLTLVLVVLKEMYLYAGKNIDSKSTKNRTIESAEEISWNRNICIAIKDSTIRH